MTLASDNQPLRPRFRIELWAWSTWLVLCVVSYPAVVLLWTAPRAGLLGGLAVGAFLLLAASFGYSGRSEFERWLWPAISSLTAAAGVAALAFFADRTSIQTAAFAALTVIGEIIFIWHFLPWIMRDAEVAHTPAAPSFQFLPRGARTPITVRASLGLVLLLAFLVLGLGAAWARGDKQVPSPTGWLIALAFLALALMFVERMSFFDRSAREGNLFMPAGCYRKWIAAGLLLLLLAAALAAAAPWRPAPTRTEATRTDSAGVERPAAPAPQSSGPRQTTAQALAALKQLGVAALGVPRALLALWLLLLLLLLALVLVWGFRRTRSAKRLTWLVEWMISLAARAWQRLLSAFKRLLPGYANAPAAAAPAAEEPADPFFDPFEHPEALAGLAPREVVIRTYHLLLNFAEMLGHGRPPGQTPFEYAQGLRHAAPQASESVMRLTWAYAGAMYGGDLASPPEPIAVHQAWQQISQALTADISPDDLDLRRRAYLATRALEHRR